VFPMTTLLSFSFHGLKYLGSTKPVLEGYAVCRGDIIGQVFTSFLFL